MKRLFERFQTLRLVRGVLLLALLALLAPAAWADSFPVMVTVVMSSGTNTPGAAGVKPAEGVTVFIKETGQNETTDANGGVRFASVPEGDLTIVAAKAGMGQTIKQYTLKGPLPGNVLIFLSASGFSTMDRPPEKPDTVYVAFSGSTAAGVSSNPGQPSTSPLSGAPMTNLGTIGMIALGQDPFAMGTNPPVPTMPGTDASNPAHGYQTNVTASENTIMVLDPEQPTKVRYVDTQARGFWVTFNAAGTKLFVSTDKQTIQVFDVNNNNSEIASLPTGGAVTDLVRAGNFVYASIMGSQPGVLVIDPQRVVAARFVPVPNLSTGQHAQPRSVAVNADGTRLYVALDGGSAGEIAVVDAFSTRVLGYAKVGAQPLGVAITPDGRFILAACARAAMVSIVDAYTLAEIGRVGVGVAPARIALRPDGTKAYVTCKGSNTVNVINLQTLAPGAVIPVGNAPLGIAVTSNGAKVFVGCSASGTVSIIDGNNDTFIKSTSPQPRGQPYGVTIKP